MLLFKTLVIVVLCAVFILFLGVWIVNCVFSDVEPPRFEDDEGYY